MENAFNRCDHLYGIIVLNIMYKNQAAYLSHRDNAINVTLRFRFRCMDLDGDGYLSMYELEYFYEEQLQRMEQLGIETLPFEDCLCQVGAYLNLAKCFSLNIKMYPEKVLQFF